MLYERTESDATPNMNKDDRQYRLNSLQPSLHVCGIVQESGYRDGVTVDAVENPVGAAGAAIGRGDGVGSRFAQSPGIPQLPESLLDAVDVFLGAFRAEAVDSVFDDGGDVFDHGGDVGLRAAGKPKPHLWELHSTTDHPSTRRDNRTDLRR